MIGGRLKSPLVDHTYRTGIIVASRIIERIICVRSHWKEPRLIKPSFRQRSDWKDTIIRRSRDRSHGKRVPFKHPLI